MIVEKVIKNKVKVGEVESWDQYKLLEKIIPPY